MGCDKPQSEVGMEGLKRTGQDRGSASGGRRGTGRGGDNIREEGKGRAHRLRPRKSDPFRTQRCQSPSGGGEKGSRSVSGSRRSGRARERPRLGARGGGREGGWRGGGGAARAGRAAMGAGVPGPPRAETPGRGGGRPGCQPR